MTDEAVDTLGAECYGSLGQCDAQPGFVLCEESLNATLAGEGSPRGRRRRSTDGAQTEHKLCVCSVLEVS